MIRLLGAITGSALALATILVVIGIPQFKAKTLPIDRSVVTLPLPTAPVEPAGVVDGDAVAADATPAAVAAAPTEPVDDVAAEDLDRDLAAAVAALPTNSLSDTDVPPSAAEEAPDLQHWYAFWSPFRSEIAASGFVEQLQRVTGLDYRVVKLKPGVYEVAFAYEDDAEITNNLSQITAATGLEIPEG